MATGDLYNWQLGTYTTGNWGLIQLHSKPK